MMKYINTEQFIADYRAYLKNHGITNTHVARQMNISPQQLQNVFKKQELTVYDLMRLCNAVNMRCTIEITLME